MIRNLKKLRKRPSGASGKTRQTSGRTVDPLRLDPTRTVTLRRAACSAMRRKFAILRGRLVKLVVTEDALGLKEPKTFSLNSNPEGCNQYTGPGCGGLSEKGRKVFDEVVRIAEKLPPEAKQDLLSALEGLRDNPDEDFDDWGAAGIVDDAIEQMGDRATNGFGQSREGQAAYRRSLAGLRKAKKMVTNCGGEGGAPGPCPTLSQKVVGLLRSKYAKFSERYGKRGVVALMAAMAVTMPLPGNIFAVLGVAEGVRAASKYLGNEDYGLWFVLNYDPEQDRDDHGRWVSGFTTSSRVGHELTDSARSELRKTVDEKDYELFRGVGLISHRITPEQAKELNSLKEGDDAPQWLTVRKVEGKVHAISSYTKSESVAKRYKEGEVSVVLRGMVPHERVVADLSNLKRLGGIDEDTVKYGKKEKEVAVQGPVPMKIHSIKFSRGRNVRGFANNESRSSFDDLLADVQDLYNELWKAQYPTARLPGFNADKFTEEYVRQIKATENSNPEGCNQWTGPGCGGLFGKEWQDSLSEDERDAISDYAMDSERLNSALRNGFSNGDPELDSALQKASTDKEMVLYRGLPKDPGWEVGQSISDRAYLSLSTSRGIAESFADEFADNGGPIIIATLPKGSPASEIGKLSTSHASEGEILGARNSSMRVSRIDESGDRIVFYVDIFYPKATTNRWKFKTTPQKVMEFQRWLREQADKELLGVSDRELWESFAEAGFRKGSGRAFDDVNRGRRWSPGQGDFYRGSREHFLRSSFGRPETVEKLQLLSSRSFTDLKNVIDDMATRMSRTLMDGLARGDNPRDMVDGLIEDLDISEVRAEAIARTEIIRAHAEGQLDAMERMGVEEVGVAVEWSTAGDLRVCPMCATLEGIVLTVEEAHGLIPAHPNCRCAFLPANVGEDESGQKRTKEEIDDAFRESGMDDPPEVDAARPKSFLNKPTKNIYVKEVYEMIDSLREFSRQSKSLPLR